MKAFSDLFTSLVVFLAVVSTFVFLYHNYKAPVSNYLFGDDMIGIVVRDVTLTVSIADDEEERKQGLSGVEELSTLEGKLFVFDEEGQYGFWMKDMLIPIDIIWINDNLEIVHIEEDVRPDTYPTIFNSPVPARFVLETNSHITSTFNIHIGDKVLIPSNRLPADLRY